MTYNSFNMLFLSSFHLNTAKKWWPFIHFFTDFMSDIFGDSQRQFHNTFSQTYGHLYERNAFIFRDYFQELRKYYERGNENLFETTNRLFTKLYQKMFQVSFYMNKYYINEIYLFAWRHRFELDIKPSNHGVLTS